MKSRFQEEPIRSQNHGISAPLQVFDWQEHFWVDGHIEEGWTVASGRGQPKVVGLREMDLEPVDYDLDISREVEPQKKSRCWGGYCNWLVFPTCSFPNHRRFPSQSVTLSPTLRSPWVQRSWRNAGNALSASRTSWPDPGDRWLLLSSGGFFNTNCGSAHPTFFISVQNLQPSAMLDFSELSLVLQQQERIMNVSQVLASEASQKSKLVAGRFHKSWIWLK